MDKHNNTKKIKREILFYKLNIVLFIIIISEICILGFNVLSQNSNFMNTVALATTVKPETFTELYFENNAKLPSTVTQNKTFHFSFTVHNLEYQKYTYPYEVSLQQNGKNIEVSKGTFTLQQNQYKTIAETYILTQQITRAKIDVNLTNLNQDIFFWINGKGVNEIQ